MLQPGAGRASRSSRVNPSRARVSASAPSSYWSMSAAWSTSLPHASCSLMEEGIPEPGAMATAAARFSARRSGGRRHELNEAFENLLARRDAGGSQLLDGDGGDETAERGGLQRGRAG